MAQLFPTNERSFLLPWLASNCVQVAIPSSHWNTRRLCFLRIVVAHHGRDVFTRRVLTARELRTFLSFILRCNYTCGRSFLIRRALLSRRARFRLGYDLFVTHDIKPGQVRARYVSRRDAIDLEWPFPTIDYCACSSVGTDNKKKGGERREKSCVPEEARETKGIVVVFRCHRKAGDTRFRERQYGGFCKMPHRVSSTVSQETLRTIREDGLTRRGRTIHIVCTGEAVGIKSAASWLHRLRQRTNIHRYFVLTRLYEQSAGAAPRRGKLFVPQTHLAPFREILLE